MNPNHVAKEAEWPALKPCVERTFKTMCATNETTGLIEPKKMDTQVKNCRINSKKLKKYLL